MASNLSGKVPALVLFELQILLHLFVSHFNNPSSWVKFEGLYCINLKVWGKQCISITVLTFSEEVQIDLDAGELSSDGWVSDWAAVLHALGLLESLETMNLRSSEQVNLQFGFLTDPMTLLCILMLFMMVDMLFIALLGSLFAKTLGVHRQYVYFCSWIKGAMFFCLATLI